MGVDQVAVELYGSARGRTRQAIRALRRRELPPLQDVRHCIDRLTAVRNGFGDRVSIGDVRDALHPLGGQGEETCRYRTADSVRIRVPTLPGPVTVHEIRVQPRDEDLPGGLAARLDRASPVMGLPGRGSGARSRLPPRPLFPPGPGR